jgi:hypothetical protein
MAPDSLSVIRFDRLLKDSAVVQAWVPGTESEIVVLRISSAKRPASAQDVAGSSKLPPDRCNASWKAGHGGYPTKVQRRDHRLPRGEDSARASIAITEFAEVEGVVVRVGCIDYAIRVHLQAANGELYPCQVRDRAMARGFAQLLYWEAIRVGDRG